MARINVSTGKSSGISQMKTRRFIPRQLETDADTRKSDRKGVTMLPASTAIINVYQLVNKMKHGGAAEKRSGKILRTSPQKGITSGAGTRIVEKPINIEIRKSRVIPVRGVNGNGDLVPLKGESNKIYMEQNAKHRGGEAKLKEDEENLRIEKFAEESIRQKAEAEKKIAGARAESPGAILFRRVKQERIPTDTKVATWERDTRYSMRDPESDFEKITKAIDNAVAEGRMKEVPPPIVGVSTKFQGQPKWYFIKNDLSESRKRKLMRSKAKRPITHSGKKKCVVIKHKKGGKK